MDLQTMSNYIRTRYATDLGEAEFTAHINEVYRDVSTLFTPDVTETYEDDSFITVTEQAVYRLPVLSRQIKQVHFETGEGNVRLRTMMEESLIYPRRKGVPIYWYSFGFKDASPASGIKQEFGLDPVPDDSVADSVGKKLIVLYEPVPVALEANDDQPEYVPEELHYLICWGTLAILAGKQEDYNTAQYWEAKYRSAYNEKLMNLGKSRYANFPEATRKLKGE